MGGSQPGSFRRTQNAIGLSSAPRSVPGKTKETWSPTVTRFWFHIYKKRPKEFPVCYFWMPFLPIGRPKRRQNSRKLASPHTKSLQGALILFNPSMLALENRLRTASGQNGGSGCLTREQTRQPFSLPPESKGPSGWLTAGTLFHWR